MERIPRRRRSGPAVLAEFVACVACVVCVAGPAAAAPGPPHQGATTRPPEASVPEEASATVAPEATTGAPRVATLPTVVTTLAPVPVGEGARTQREVDRVAALLVAVAALVGIAAVVFWRLTRPVLPALERLHALSKRRVRRQAPARRDAHLAQLRASVDEQRFRHGFPLADPEPPMALAVPSNGAAQRAAPVVGAARADVMNPLLMAAADGLVLDPHEEPPRTGPTPAGPGA